MKKLIILSVVFLLGMSRLSAQGAYNVTQEWSYDGSVCQFQDLPGDRFMASIEIYDIANNILVYDGTQFVATNIFSATFNVQTEVQAHCSNPLLEFPPNFKIYSVVRMVNITPPGVLYCGNKDTNSGITCNSFSAELTLNPISIS